jgi:hypothetical protein
MTDTGFTAFESAELTAESIERLGLLVAQILQFETLLDDGGTPVHPGSPFVRDDAAIAPYAVSAIAWASIAVAIDHLSLLAALLQKLDSLYTIAPYTLIRPAIESAAAAVWMLSPKSRYERATRTLQLVYNDELDAHRVTDAAGQPKNENRAQLKERFVALAEHHSEIDSKRVTSQLKIGEMIVLATEEVDSGDSNAIMWWNMLSALNHGRQNGVLALLQREQLAPVSERGTMPIKLKASPAALARGMEIGVRFVNTALGFYAIRNMSPAERMQVNTDGIDLRTK